MKVNNNPNCDGNHCRQANGEVRVLPSGGDSNLILCLECFCHEMDWRKERNRERAFRIPTWNSLKVYDAEGK